MRHGQHCLAHDPRRGAGDAAQPSDEGDLIVADVRLEADVAQGSPMEHGVPGSREAMAERDLVGQAQPTDQVPVTLQDAPWSVLGPTGHPLPELLEGDLLLGAADVDQHPRRHPEALEVLGDPDQDRYEIAPVFNPVQRLVRIESIEVKPIEELTAEDFIGSSPDAHDIESLKFQMGLIYDQSPESFEGSDVTRITIHYLR